MTDERYTLDEARRELDRRACMVHGHDWDILMVDGGDTPAHIICGRCGQTHRVESEPVEKPSDAGLSCVTPTAGEVRPQ